MGIGAFTSGVVHVLILGVALWFSSRPPVEEEEPPLLTFVAPRPAPPPPAAASAATEHREVKPRPRLRPEAVVKAKDTTPQPEEQQASAEAVDEAPAEDGVPGGVKDGLPGGLVGSAIGEQLRGAGDFGGEALSFGEGMTRPRQLKGRAPDYTREAREAQIEGTMIVQCVITTEGDLRGCRIIKPLPYMGQAVLDALKTWKMTPVMFQGRPVAVKYNIPIRLVLPR